MTTHDAAPTDGWLTTKEAAAHLGYRSPQAIRALIARGKLAPMAAEAPAGPTSSADRPSTPGPPPTRPAWIGPSR